MPVVLPNSNDDMVGGVQEPYYKIGGTSVGAACWAGMIAIADQYRADEGLPSLNGLNQTLPSLYNLPSTDFNDITGDGINNGNDRYLAGKGYDLPTGLGTPIASSLVPHLASMVSLQAPEAIEPLGSLAYESTGGSKVMYSGDIDGYTFAADPNQTLSVVVKPSSALQPSIDLIDPNGASIASTHAAGGSESALLPATSVSTSGIYIIHVSGYNGTTGSYTVQVYLDAAPETVSVIGGPDGTIDTAQHLDSSVETLSAPLGSGTATTVLGTMGVNGGISFYGFSLNPNEPVTIGLKNLSGSGATFIAVDKNDQPIGNNNNLKPLPATNLDKGVTFTPVIGDTYYAEVSATGPTTYSLVVTLDATFDGKANGSLSTAEDIAGTSGVLGDLASSSPDWYQITLPASQNSLQVETSIPLSGPTQILDGLYSSIQLYNASGTLIASGIVLGDGQNAFLQAQNLIGGNTYYIQVTPAANPAGTTGEYSLAFATFDLPLTITTPSLTSWVTNHAYSQTVQASGGTGTLTFSGWNLPSWLTLSSSGVLSGTPTTTGSYTFTVTVADALSNASSQSYTVNISEPPFSGLQVLAITETAWGFSVQFNGPFAEGALTPVLYGTGYGSSAPYPSVTLTQTAGTPPPGYSLPYQVQGSLILNPTTILDPTTGQPDPNTIAFVATDTGLEASNNSPILPDGTYVVNIAGTAAHDGFRAAWNNSLLNGGSDYTHTFTVSATAGGDDTVWVPSNADVVWVPATAVGPGQPLNAPGGNAADAGYPVYLKHLSANGNISSVRFTFNYNPVLLTVTGASSNGALTGSSFVLVSNVNGVAVFQYTDTSANNGTNSSHLTRNEVPLGYIVAVVPSGTAASPMFYGSTEILHLSNVSINSGAIPAATADAVHLVAYVGDANNALQTLAYIGAASLDIIYANNCPLVITDVMLNDNTCFVAYALIDPVIAADTDGAGYIPSDAPLQVEEVLAGFLSSLGAIPTNTWIVF